MGKAGKHTFVRLGLLVGLALPCAVATSVLCPASVEAKAAIKKHKIYKGQTLGKIAKRYLISVEALCEANGIGRRDPIKPGQVLWIPPRDDEDGTKTRAAREKAEARAGEGATKDESDEPTKRSSKEGGPSKKELEAGVRWHEIYKGQKLGSIAKRYHVTVDALCHANAIDRRAPIQPGQMLLVPHRDDEGGEVARALHDAGAKAPAEESKQTSKASKSAPKAVSKRSSKKHSWDPYVKKPPRPRYVTLVGRHDRSWKGTAVTRRGNARSYARRHIGKVLATKSGKTKPIHPRLIELLAEVSDTFGGRTIRVVSGVRLGKTPDGSRHRHGRAVDFVVEGVPNEALRDFVKTFDQVGVGYYPNSHFVHLDVRDQWTYWIDLSSPGQRPRYAGFWTKPSKSAKPRRLKIRKRHHGKSAKASGKNKKL